jgi:hypothetical protein
MTEPRGIRNANPMNLRHGDDWWGLSPTRSDPAFCTFVETDGRPAEVWGIRAGARILLRYQRKHRLTCIRDFITRWAPPNENDTAAYVRSVSASTNRAPTEFYDVTDPAALAALVTAIITHENGVQPYSDKTIREGVALALA